MELTREAAYTTLIAILREHVDESVAISRESTMTGDLSLDSLELMEILAEVEDRLEVRVPDAILPELRTVGDIVAALERHLAEKGALRG